MRKSSKKPSQNQDTQRKPLLSGKWAHLIDGTVADRWFNPELGRIVPVDYEVGRVAKLYEEMGGQVHWIGKPHRAIYDHALSLVPKQGRVVCIGDSLAHDIAGAHSLGLQTALVQSGLSANLSMVEIEETASSLGALPDFIVPQFSLD